jgi:hypothetical protein
MFTIYIRPGFHQKPEDPVYRQVEDREEAALIAGELWQLKQPGACGSNKYMYYAIDADGKPVEGIDSYECDHCRRMTAWCEDGPLAIVDGKVVEDGRAYEHRLVDWVCPACADKLEGAEADEDDEDDEQTRKKMTAYRDSASIDYESPLASAEYSTRHDADEDGEGFNSAWGQISRIVPVLPRGERLYLHCKGGGNDWHGGYLDSDGEAWHYAPSSFAQSMYC